MLCQFISEENLGKRKLKGFFLMLIFQMIKREGGKQFYYNQISETDHQL